MYEFNQDGSIKLPSHIERSKRDKENKLKNQRCIKICREIVSFSAPKKCILKIKLSETINDNRFIETIYKTFNFNAAVPNKLRKISEKEFEIEIGTDFKRCSDCNRLIGQYREFLDGNIIDEKNSCTYEGRTFSYEDHFD